MIFFDKTGRPQNAFEVSGMVSTYAMSYLGSLDTVKVAWDNGLFTVKNNGEVSEKLPIPVEKPPVYSRRYFLPFVPATAR